MTILRAGCYERVSTDEQAKYGYSIRTQIDELTEYCQKNKIKIVDHYTDEGVSGGKPLNKRPQLMRLIEDVKAGKIDIILFTKLDRWSRNTKEFFKAQDILDELKVEWKAIHEKYDTTTPDGRMAITIFLAIAQNEREKGADRVKHVFEGKRKRKETWFNKKSTPFGYMKQNDEDGIPRLVKNPEVQDAVQDFFDLTLRYSNAMKAQKEVNERYGLTRTRKMWYGMLQNEIYTGIYKGVEGYCEPYILKADLEKLQLRKNVRQTKNNRTYLFTGLLICPDCGGTLKSSHTTNVLKSGKRVEYYAYRCNKGVDGLCSYRDSIFEIGLEQKLLARIDEEVKRKIDEVENARVAKKKKPKNNVNALKERLRRLEIVYMAGNKSDDEYIAESAEIKKLINAAEQEQRNDIAEVDVSKLKAFLESDYKETYYKMDRERKQIFWRNTVRGVYMDGKQIKSVDLIF